MRKKLRPILEISLVVTAALLTFLLILEICLRIMGVMHLRSAHDYTREKEKSVYTILCLGDSYTYGIGAAGDKSYPRQLEGLLNSGSSKKIFKVVNLGVGSYNTTQILNEFNGYISKNSVPDMAIILGGGANYWNYWGYHTYIKGNNLFSRISDCLYRVRIYKLVKLLFMNVAERMENNTAGGKAGDNGDVLVSYYEKGWHCQKNKQYPEAIEWFKKGIEENIRDKSDYYEGIGKSYEAMGQYEEAIKWLKKGIAVNPYNSRCYHIIGSAYAQQAYYDEAIKWFKNGLKVNPLDSDCYYGIGFAYESQSRYAEAIEWFMRGVEVDPADSNCYAGLARSVYGKEGDYDKAVSYLSKYLENSEDDLDMLNVNIARFYSSLKKDAERSRLLGFLSKDTSIKRFTDKGYINMLEKSLSTKSMNKAIEEWIVYDLGSIINICKRNGIKVILQDYPFPYPNSRAYSHILYNVAGSNSVPFISNYQLFYDLLKKGAQQKEYFSSDGHCNARGYKIMAGNIYDKIARENMFGCLLGQAAAHTQE
ncbi:MAG: tetratricopeptide repeat protein [Candidatus Omnitrophota bacterium]